MSNKKDIAEEVFISPEALQAWSAIAQKAVQAMPGIKPSEISEEVIYLNPDQETLTVFTTIRKIEIMMKIPKGQWRWNKNPLN